MNVKETKNNKTNSSRCGGSTTRNTRKKNVKCMAKNVWRARSKIIFCHHETSQPEKGQHKKGMKEYNKSQKKQ